MIPQDPNGLLETPNSLLGKKGASSADSNVRAKSAELPKTKPGISDSATETVSELSFNGISLERARRDIEDAVLADTRRRILELALLLEKGQVTKRVIEDTQESLAKVMAEMESRRGKDALFNYPLLETVTRIMFDDLPLVFGRETQVEEALNVLQRVFRQRYNAVVVADEGNRAVGLVPSAVLVNSELDATLGKIPTVAKDFSVTLETRPEEVSAIMDRLAVNVLPVVDSKGLVIGIFTSRDHVKGTSAIYSKKLKTEIETHAAIEGMRGTIEGTADA